MKILIVRSYGSIMNINTYNCQELGLAKALTKKGIQCGIILFNGKNEDYTQIVRTEDGKKIYIYWLKGISILKQGIMFSIDNIIKDYDVIWVNEFNQYTSYKICKYSNKKVVIYHGPYKPLYSKIRMIRNTFFEKLFFNKKIANNIPVFTKSNLTTIGLKKLGFKNVTTLGVGLDTTNFNKSSIKPKFIDELSYFRDNGGKILTYIGSIDKRKNTLLILNILKEIVNIYDVKVLLIGKGNKKYIKNCYKYIKKYKLEKCVVYKESLPQNQLKYIYNNSDCFLLPTKYEIFGMVLMEAMYYNVPVITTYNGGSSTLIEDKVNGYICSENKDEWIKVIKTLFDDLNLRTKIGELAHKTIIDNFTWDEIANKVNTYLELL